MCRLTARSARMLAPIFFAALARCASPPPPPPPPAPAPAPAPVAKPSVVLPIAQLDRSVRIVSPDSVLFKSGKVALHDTASALYLDRIAVLLTTKTEKLIAVEGLTDHVGAGALNLKLLEQRADAQVASLIAHGVPVTHVSKRGLSFSQPAAPNDVDAGRRLNRAPS